MKSDCSPGNKGVAGFSIEIAAKAGSLIKEIVPQIQKTSELIAEIDASSNEQARGIKENTRAVEQLDQVIQQNSAAAEEISSTSGELSAQASRLIEVISFFKIGNEAGSAFARQQNKRPMGEKKALLIDSGKASKRKRQRRQPGSCGWRGGF